MPTNYTIQEGDCLYSIATTLGFHPDTLWNHPGNTPLKSKNRKPTLLCAGDNLEIPDKPTKSVPKASGNKARFKKLRTQTKLRLKLIDDGKARAGLAYTIKTSAQTIDGKTTAEGLIEATLPPTETQATLILPDTGEQYDLSIGGLDPVEEPTGVQARLANLGYCESLTLPLSDNDLKTAIGVFQEEQGLPVTGNADQVSRERLVAVFGC